MSKSGENVPVKQFFSYRLSRLGFFVWLLFWEVAVILFFKPHIAWIIVGVMSVGYAVFLYFDAFSKKDYRSPVMYTLLSFSVPITLQKHLRNVGEGYDVLLVLCYILFMTIIPAVVYAIGVVVDLIGQLNLPDQEIAGPIEPDTKKPEEERKTKNDDESLGPFRFDK